MTNQTNSTAEDLLETLLNKTEADYQFPGAAPRKLVLYGAGNLGRAILRRLRAAGIEPLAFADDTESKRGQTMDGLRIFAPEEIGLQFGPDALFIVTVLNPALRFLDARKNLQARGSHDVLSLLEAGRIFPSALLPFSQYDTAGRILEHASAIRRAFSIFSDEESRRQFVAHVEFRLTARYEVLPAKSQPAYFPPDLIGGFAADCTFVDCGAYDGDTIRQFLAHQSGQFGEIIAFEPDRKNFDNLCAYVQSLGPDVSSRIQLYHGAVGDRSGEIAFNETGDMSAAISAEAAGRVRLFALDDVVRPRSPDIYIKFDIEGFELPALEGAKGLLDSKRPTLAVSAYHRPGDLWEIPLHLHDLGVGYQLALRTEGDDGMDVVCYAVPRRASIT